jgi:hypothetical protein
VITGAVRRGSPLQSGLGTWLNEPSSYTFIWQRLSRRRWSTIDGAERARYVATTRDLGRRLRVVVAAENQDGTTASTSSVTVPVGGGAIDRATRRSHRAR